MQNKLNWRVRNHRIVKSAVRSDVGDYGEVELGRIRGIGELEVVDFGLRTDGAADPVAVVKRVLGYG